MIKPHYRGVKLDVHHNNPRDGFSAQALEVDDAETGFALEKLVVKK